MFSPVQPPPSPSSSPSPSSAGPLHLHHSHSFDSSLGALHPTSHSRVLYSRAIDLIARAGIDLADVSMLFLMFVIDALLCCLPLVNITAFVAIGFQLSYAMPILLRLTSAKDTFVQTPTFSLGRLSRPIGWPACG